jgi:hypothetical protein
MNVSKLNITMRRYIYCLVAVILLLYGIIFLLSSCTTEIVINPNHKDGPRVTVNFALNIGVYGNDEAVATRSSKNPQRITKMVQVTKDIYMYAVFEEERPVSLRSSDTIPLNPGSIVRIVAYGGAPAYTTIIDTATYYITGGNLLPVGGSGTGIEVTEGDSYVFVAYTFNDNIPLPKDVDFQFNAATRANPDLLWGISDPVIIPLNAVYDDIDEVKITLNHLFSRVRVEASTAEIDNPPVTIKKIDSAYVTPSYSMLTLRAAAGKMEPDDPANPENKLTEIKLWQDKNNPSQWWLPNNLDFKEAISEHYYIFTNYADAIAIKIGNLKVGDGADLLKYEFRFTNSTPSQPLLQPGCSYTLKLNFRRLTWAGSNIYWDDANQRLTFLPETTPPWEQGLQGVYFMWGSLIGISPVGPFVDSNTALYVPSNPSATPSAWNIQTNLLANIPRVSAGISLVSPDWLDNHSSRNYLSEVHDSINFRGDICRYLTYNGDAPSGNWRMPNAREFGTELSEYGTNTLNPVSPAVLEDGTFNFYNLSHVTKIVSNTVFPAGGSRDVSRNIQGETRYLSGSPTWTLDRNILSASFNLHFINATASPVSFSNHAPLDVQGPVRCVKLGVEGRPTDVIVPTVDVEVWVDGGELGRTPDTVNQGEVWY